MFRDTQLLSWIAATVAGFVTAYLAIKNFRLSIEQRRLDLKWKKANAANELIHEFHKNENAALAIQTLDWVWNTSSLEKYVNGDLGDVVQILRDPSRRGQIDDDTSKLLLAFDWFFYYVDRIENNIREGFFDFENVKYILFPYYEKINTDREVFSTFCISRRYFLADKFWGRFDADKFWAEYLTG